MVFLIKQAFPTLVFAQNDATAKTTIEIAQRMCDMGATVMFAMPGSQAIKVTHNLPTTKSICPAFQTLPAPALATPDFL